MNVHWWPPMTCTGLSAFTSVPVRSPLDVTTWITSPAFTTTCPLPAPSSPPMPPLIALCGPAVIVSVVLSWLAVTA
jgi:hypothetical protein